MADRIHSDPELWRRTAGAAQVSAIVNACANDTNPLQWPQAGEAATELGADQDGGPRHPITGARPLVIFILAALALVGCAAVVVLVR